MNSAKRIEQILSKVKLLQRGTSLVIFEKVFEVKGCVSVCKKLMLVNNEIEYLKEKLHKDLYDYLALVFSCKNIQRSLDGEIAKIDNYIMALNSIANYMPQENIDEDSILELSELIVSMQDKVNNIDLSEHHKLKIDLYIDEMSQSIIDFGIGGKDAFEKHIVVANGTVILYNEAFMHKDISEFTRKIFKESTAILSALESWKGALGFAGGLFLCS